MGSMISSAAPPIRSTARCSSGMSCEGSNGTLAPCWTIPSMKWQRVRSAPDAIRRGTRVSSATSSDDQTNTLPALVLAAPSGQWPPVVMTAPSPSASVVLPVPAAPARMVSFPAGSQPGHSQSIAKGLMSAPQRILTMRVSSSSARLAVLAAIRSGSAFSDANRVMGLLRLMCHSKVSRTPSARSRDRLPTDAAARPAGAPRIDRAASRSALSVRDSRASRRAPPRPCSPDRRAMHADRWQSRSALAGRNQVRARPLAGRVADRRRLGRTAASLPLRAACSLARCSNGRGSSGTSERAQVWPNQGQRRPLAWICVCQRLHHAQGIWLAIVAHRTEVA
jgi:hypothetical protein